ncbi:MAG: S1C family serine protease [Actinomycetota bacterium]
MVRRFAFAAVALSLAAGACGWPATAPPATSGSPAPLAPSPVVAAPGEDPVVAVVRAVLPSVVNVTADVLETSLVGGARNGTSVGTGFIVRADGIIVTNYHVVERASRITVTTSGEDPRQYTARVIGGDPEADLAVLKVDASDLPEVRIGSADTLELGQSVVAIGFALALEGGPTVTRGVVSALDRTITVPDPNCAECENGSRTYARVVQTDAAINPGNSGGPLVDLSGAVVGINSAGTTRAENIGFAIAIDAAVPTIEQAEREPDQPVAYLGVVAIDVTPVLAVQEGLRIDAGAYIVALTPQGPAERSGIEVGEVIVSLGGVAVDGGTDLGEAIRRRAPGDRVEVVLVDRAGDRRTLVVTLGTNPLPTA